MSIHFPTMVHFVKPIVDYARGVKMLLPELAEKHPYFKLLFQDEDLVVLANTLIELIPVLHDNIKYHTKSIQPVGVAHLTEEMEVVISKVISDFHLLTQSSQTETEKIQVWNFICTIQDQFASRPWHYDYYGLLIDNLYKVTFVPQIKLLRCDLCYDHGKTYLNVEWSGPFKGIEFITISGITQSFWYAICSGDDSVLSLNVMRYFLHLQVSAGWGENKWLPGQVESNENLTATLQLLQADSSAPPSELPLSETIWDNVSDYIMRQFYPKHIEVSERLEVKLREELQRRQSYVAQGLLDSKFVNQISQWIDGLIAYREAYRKEVSANQK